MDRYQQRTLAHREEGEAIARDFKDIINDLTEWEVKEGDQEAFLSRHKAQGYAITPKVRRDTYRAFSAALDLVNEKTTTGRKRALQSLSHGEAGYGVRDAEDISEATKLRNEGRLKAERAELLRKMRNRYFRPIGKMVDIHSATLTWDIVIEHLKKYAGEHEEQYGSRIAADRAEDQQRAAKGK